MQIYSKIQKRVDLLRHENIENVIKDTRQKTIVYRDVVFLSPPYS
jgi:16S rRNA G966 N2-methylase RsmD